MQDMQDIKTKQYSLEQIAKHSGCKLLRGDAATIIKGVAHFTDAKGDDIIFWIKPQKDLNFLQTTQAAAIMLDEKFAKEALQELPSACAVLVAPAEEGDVQQSFIKIMGMYQPQLREESREESREELKRASATIAPSAVVASTAKLGKNTSIDAGAVIGAYSVIGDNCKIGANVVIADEVEVGDNSTINAGVVVYSQVTLGSNVIIHSGCVLGGDGFGYMKFNGIHNKIPHTAGVIIGDDVEIGANSSVDRGAMSDTRVGSGTKIDNLCQIGHSAVVGKNCILCTAANIGGSARVDDDCVFAGRTGCVDNVHIGKGTIVYVGGIAVKDTVAGAHIGGIYGKDNRQHLRELAALKRLASAKSGDE